MIPENLNFLYAGEEKLRTEMLKRIQASPDLSLHILIIERAMNLIHSLLPSSRITDDDQLMLGNLGIRLFNGLASGIKLLFAGYYQTSALLLRDLLETAFLLDYFSTDPKLITQWRTMDADKRQEKFKPVQVRIALDKRDNFVEKKRAAAYKLLSTLAGHATPEGMVMLVPDPAQKYVHCGPFLENSAINAVLAEAAKLAVQATSAFASLIDTKGLEQAESRIAYMEVQAEWCERFLGRKKELSNLRELRALLDATKKAAYVTTSVTE